MRISDWSSDVCSSDLSIESIAGKHVNFIDDINLVSGRIGAFARYIDDRTNIVDAGMAGGVHLQNVDMPPLANGHAGFAEAAGIDGGTALPVRADAVQRLGDRKNTRLNSSH